ALSLLFAPYPRWFRGSGYLTIGLSLAVTGGLWLLHAGHYDTNSLGSRLKSLAPKWLLKPIQGPVASFAAGLRGLGKPFPTGGGGGLSGGGVGGDGGLL